MALILRPRTAREYWLSGMQATDFIERNYVDDERIAYCRGSAPIKLLSSMSMQRCATFPVALRRNGRADGHPPCANEALKVVANGAASPREAILTQLLSAPLNRGGYALPLPVLSHQIEIRGAMRQCSSKSFSVADLCWPDRKLVVEFDSEERHCNPKKMAEDARKRADLSFMGYEVLTVTNSQMRNLRDMDLLADLLRKRFS